MKVVDFCVCCESRNISRTPSTMAEFITKRVFGWSQATAKINGVDVGFPSRTDCIHCADCDFLFCDWRFDDEEMRKLYDGYRGSGYVRDRESFEPGYALVNDALGKSETELRTRRENLQNQLLEHLDFARVASVLDYGGDEGQFIPACLDGADRSVYDISGKCVQNGIGKISDEAELGIYDFVMCCHVLEHCSYPREFVQKIKNCARHYAYFEVPMERSKPSGRTYLQVFSEHINQFNEASFLALLNREGFLVIDMRLKEVETALGVGKNIMALCATGNEAAIRHPSKLQAI